MTLPSAPEQDAIDDAIAESNPLLDQRDLPRFAAFAPADVTPALDRLLADAESALACASDPAAPATWEGFVVPLEAATERLGRGWSMVGHLNAVMDSPELRETFNANLPRVTAFWTRLGQDEGLYAKYKALRASAAFLDLDPARARVIDHALRDFKLSGADLERASRERFAQIQETLAAIQQRFSENVLDATNQFELVVDDTPAGRARLDGVPEDAIAAARAGASSKDKSGYRFTLQFPSYFPIIQYARDRSLREAVYRAYVTRAYVDPTDKTRASDAHDNSVAMREILALREEKAQLLGYASYADVSLATKMAESPAAVETFLRDLAARARPFAERDLREVRDFARASLGLEALAAWDMAYAGEALKVARYAFSDNEVKQYFQLPRVLDGLFGLIERLFGVTVRADQAEAWHGDVRFFRIEETRSESTPRLVGQFYLDLYARDSKQPGAWMDDCRGRHREAGSKAVQTPVAHLVCNFQQPPEGRPALLTHDEVGTLFHEFGHGLHHMLTRIDALGVSGISGVEWDAVELPSQFMENWAWEWEIVESMSRHVDTGQPMPKALFDKMVQARNFQAGLQTLRQIEFSLFDMALHHQPAPPTAAPVTSGSEAPAAPAADPIQATLERIRDEVAVLKPPPFNRFQNSFSHIFAGGYAAGYYSYKWAEVLSADCFAAFEEEGLGNRQTGTRFLREVLSVGGSRPAIDSFRAFRGREPTLDALLRHNGMVEKAA